MRSNEEKRDKWTQRKRVKCLNRRRKKKAGERLVLFCFFKKRKRKIEIGAGAWR
jgi:hypothetical protein